MKHILDLKSFTPNNCEITGTENTDSVKIKCSENGGHILIRNSSDSLGVIDWNSLKYLVFDVTNLEQWVMGICIRFWEKSTPNEEPDMKIIMGTLPGVKTRLALPLEALNSQKLFLGRTPGKLKTVVFGNKVDITKVTHFAIGTLKCFNKQKFEISDLHITDLEPDYPLPDIKLVDELGQLTSKDWPGKTHSINELKEYLFDEIEKGNSLEYFEHWSQFGGWKEKRFEATGYFRTQHDGDRWWLVDPEGYAFFSTGLDVIFPGEAVRIDGIEKFFTWIPEKEGRFKDAWYLEKNFTGGEYFCYAIANLIRAFGGTWKENWEKLTRRRMSQWGFNTIGNWSSIEYIRNAKQPYVIPLWGFPETEKKVFRDFPDVFSTEYQANADKYALQLKDFEGDRYLIGYFLRNEPHWAFIEDLNIAEELLENKEDLVSKDVLIEFLSSRYSSEIEKLNEAWKTSFSSFEQLRGGISKASSFSDLACQDLTDFSKKLIEQYVKIPSDAVKKVDPHHLNLGMRYAYIKNDLLYSGCENFDVFSFNCYKMNPAFEAMKIGEKTGLPVMVGEFHFGALDRGLLTMGIRGVSTQEERGKAYRYYMESGAQNPYFVGAHYFILNDQSVLGRFDGENFQIGCVDVCHKPYEEFVRYITETNKSIYEVADGRREKTSVVPKEIETNAF